MQGFNNKIIDFHLFLVTNLLIFIDNVFDILLRNNFTTAPTSEINKITKKKLAIVKKFIKFFKVLKKESTESSISNGYKNNYLSNFDF